ncbi:hypothetical protein [Paenibacillus sp. PL2-23]|uniref:hypothetical protein n=1 Tax=Paenibacillus sp. PL2-23 TaxID=2100729 RepID=UPI0030F6E817
MFVKLTAVVKVAGQWQKPGQAVELPDVEAQRLISIHAAVASESEPPDVPPINAEVEAMRAELIRLQEFEQQQLTAEANTKALAEKEEADRKAAEAAAVKGKSKAVVKDDTDGQADGK